MTTTNTTYEPGQRVTVYTHDGQHICNGVVAQDQRGADPAAWVRVKHTIAGETRTEEYQPSQLRARV